MFKRLSNRGEQRLYAELAKASERYGAEVYRKVRIADVVDIDRLPDRDLGRFALMGHFDFVVTDERHMPQFAVEFDGLGHTSTNDDKKDRVCRQTGFALFRIKDSVQRARFSQQHFVSYLVHFWHHALEFNRMVKEGEVGPDEPFMMSAFLKEDARHIFDSEWNFLGMGATKFNTAIRAKGLERWQRAHMMLEHILLVGRSDNFCAFVGGRIEGQTYVGRAKLEVSTPCLGDSGVFEPKIWELGDFCVGMAFDNLVAEVDEPSEQSIYPEATTRLVERLVERGFVMVRGGGSLAKNDGSQPTDIGLVKAGCGSSKK